MHHLDLWTVLLPRSCLETSVFFLSNQHLKIHTVHTSTIVPFSESKLDWTSSLGSISVSSNFWCVRLANSVWAFARLLFIDRPLCDAISQMCINKMKNFVSQKLITQGQSCKTYAKILPQYWGMFDVRLRVGMLVLVVETGILGIWGFVGPVDHHSCSFLKKTFQGQKDSDGNHQHHQRSGIWQTRPGVLLHWVSATRIWWSKSLLPCWRWVQSWFHKSWPTWRGLVLRQVSWMLTSWRRFPGNPSKSSENLWRRTPVDEFRFCRRFRRCFRMFYHLCLSVTLLLVRTIFQQLLEL